MKWTYLLVDFGAVLFPFLFSFHPKIRFHRHFSSYIVANLLSASLFLFWDYFYTRWGVWGFNETYISGIRFYNLPLEEILFFFCIPFACVFTYYCLTRFFTIHWPTKTTTIFVAIVAGALLLLGILHSDKAYTMMTCLSTVLLLLLMRFIWKVNWIDRVFTVYLLLLIPFFIVNGILTGTGLEEPVVWYNDDENLGIRLLTIPVEDVVYGFELFLLTIFFFEKINPAFNTTRQTSMSRRNLIS